jgi:signal transduction histidine kinase
MKRWEALLASMPPRTVDLALALSLSVVDVATIVPYQHRIHPFWLALVLVVAQNVPLVWRRTHPVFAVLAIGVPRVAYDLIGLGFAPLPLAPAIAVYTVAERAGRPERRLVAVLLVAAVTTSQFGPGHNQPYDFIEAALIQVTAWIAGALSRARRAYVRDVEGRAVTAEAAAAEERTHIARELHDVVAHHVSLIAVQAEAAMALLPARPIEADASVQIIGSTARQALTELRRLLGVLRGPAASLETSPSASLSEIEYVLDQVRGAGLPVRLEVLGTPSTLSPGIDLTAYRIVQEALTNTIRHAAASAAVVIISYEPGYLTVCVADSGSSPEHLPVGPGPEAAAGFGLAGITERVASCGGSLTIGPEPAGGFAVTARLPTR